jgi:nitrile hydratase
MSDELITLTVRAPWSAGIAVRVKRQPPEHHCRTPHYLRGIQGVILDVAGRFRDPSLLAFNKPGLPMRYLYRVQFFQRDIWPNYAGSSTDTVVADIYEHWLDIVTEDEHEHA